MASGPFTLVQLARAVGMSVEDVRFYLDRGLLQPARRRSGRRAVVLRYHQEHVDRLRFIGRALNVGFSFEDIAHFVDPHGFLTCNDVYRIASRQLEDLHRVSGAEAPSAAALEQLMATCQRTGGKNRCPILAFLSHA
jgi:DNA-binding transcriptional MerR regulator